MDGHAKADSEFGLGAVREDSEIVYGSFVWLCKLNRPPVPEGDLGEPVLFSFDWVALE